MTNSVYKAIESKAAVRAAMKEWQAKFEHGSEQLSGMLGTVNWHPRLVLWGHFGGWSKEGNTYRYWNSFGVRRPNFRQNIIVEINPPDRGVKKTMQGVLATAEDGSRWVLHKGRLSIPGKGIKEDEFDAAATSTRVPVRFSDGSTVGCHLVTGIDLPASKVQQQVATFVAKCRIIRSFYHDGPEVAAQDAEIEEAESSTPELTGMYEIEAQASKTAMRKHGEVWRALVAALDKLKVTHTNDRVGRWGPDLRTTGKNSLLFEIKVTVAAHDLQRAVGQLLLYERLLGKDFRKILVLPYMPDEKYIKSIQSLGIDVLRYRLTGNSAAFDLQSLSHLF